MKNSLKDFKVWFDEIFLDYLENKTNTLKKDNQNQGLHQVADQILSLASDGKRLRPYVLNLCYKGDPEPVAEITHQMLAIELVHLMALIHDDIMDKADLRHNVTTINSLFSDKDFSNSMAILAGDMVFNWAIEAFYVGNQNQKAIAAFHGLINEVMVGQSLDVSLSHTDIADWQEADIITKNIFKTARYSFRRPGEIGLLLRSEDGSEGDNFQQYGSLLETVGEIFQIDDDLLDVFGDQAKTGKENFKDIEEKQATLIAFNLRNNERFLEFFNQTAKLTSEDKEELLQIMKAETVLEKNLAYKQTLVEKARSIIAGLKTESEKEYFNQLLEKVINRQK